MKHMAPGGEMRIASLPLETPTSDDQVLERILERENRKRALKRVRENKGAPGVDGMKVGQLLGCLWRQWPKILKDLLVRAILKFEGDRTEIHEGAGQEKGRTVVRPFWVSGRRSEGDGW